MSDSVAHAARMRGAEDPPPSSLLARLVGKGHVPRDFTARPLSGGRTNRVWRLMGAGRAAVLKLYARPDDNPLFPNDPSAEAICLADPALRSLAPGLLACGQDPDAGDWLVYDWVDGPHWAGQMDIAARALRSLHALPAPPALRQVDAGPRAILAQGDVLLSRCRTSVADRIAALRPSPGHMAVSAPRPAFLHGDPVASNIVLSPAGPVFIDWQCPARGDPCHDIAILLSPGMRLLYQGTTGSAQDTDRFFAAYGDPEVRDRYMALGPACHWRMAAYCLWRAEAGAPGYSAAAEAELSALAKSSRPTLT